MLGIEFYLFISKFYKNENRFQGIRKFINLYDVMISINSTEFAIKKKLLEKINVA